MTTAPSTTGVRLARVTDAPLSVDEHLEAVRASAAGAVVTFIGQVRDHDPSVVGEVTSLEYSAHPDAEQVLADVVARESGFVSRGEDEDNAAVDVKAANLEQLAAEGAAMQPEPPPDMMPPDAMPADAPIQPQPPI